MAGVVVWQLLVFDAQSMVLVVVVVAAVVVVVVGIAVVETRLVDHQ